MSDMVRREDSRTARHRKSRVWARLGMVAGGVLIVVALVLAGWMVLRSLDRDEVPQRIVVIGESRLEDESVVAGLIAIIDFSGPTPTVTGVDSGRDASIPGTAFDRLRDALPMGGEDAVVEALGLDPNSTAWVTLPADTYSGLVDAGGGVKLDLPSATTVFTGERLFTFAQGRQALDGAEVAALAMGAEAIRPASAASAVRVDLAAALGERVTVDYDLVAEALDARRATSSMSREAFVSALTTARGR